MSPKKLTRKALPLCFPKVSAGSWDYLLNGIAVEKRVGLFECRTKGPDDLIYYDTEKIKEWLCERGYYAPEDFLGAPQAGKWSGLNVRRHVLV